MTEYIFSFSPQTPTLDISALVITEDIYRLTITNNKFQMHHYGVYEAVVH